VIIGRDIPNTPTQVLTAEPLLVERLVGSGPVAGPVTTGAASPDGLSPWNLASGGGTAGTAAAGPSTAGPLFVDPAEQQVARATLAVLEDFQQLPSSADLQRPDIAAKVVARVAEMVRATQPTQRTLPGLAPAVDIARVVERTIEQRNALTIDIPRIIVTPKGPAYAGFRDFDLDCTGLRPQPVSQEILIQHLQSQDRHRLGWANVAHQEKRLEDYLVFALMDHNDICYDQFSDLLYKLAGQMVRHLQGYLTNPDDVLNVLQSRKSMLAEHIYAQLQQHYEERATEYHVSVSRSFINLRPNTHSLEGGQQPRHFRDTVTDRQAIRGMLFTGFTKSLYSLVKFHSNSERVFAIVLENDRHVTKWLKPAKGDFKIHYSYDAEYIPDFVAETDEAKYLCEPKAANELTSPEVQAKTRAAALWCARASEHVGGKPWHYLLIPHDAIDESQTLAGLAGNYRVEV
jgi:type III restriction enzyme